MNSIIDAQTDFYLSIIKHSDRPIRVNQTTAMDLKLRAEDQTLPFRTVKYQASPAVKCTGNMTSS